MVIYNIMIIMHFIDSRESSNSTVYGQNKLFHNYYYYPILWISIFQFLRLNQIRHLLKLFEIENNFIFRNTIYL